MDISEKFKQQWDNIASPAIGPTFDLVCELAFDGAIGAVVPGVGNIMLAYKQQRAENNILNFINQIIARQNELNEKLEGLENDKLRTIQKHYFGIVSDYVLDVKQQEKIKYLVNGYINLAGEKETKEDVIILYYDTLDELSLLDIRILKLYGDIIVLGDKRSDSAYDVIRDYGIDEGQYRMVQEKLVRLGLLIDKNEEKLEKNLKNMADYIENLAKGKKVRFKYDKLYNSKLYHITKYGRSFINFFMES